MIEATFYTRPTRALCFDLESRPSAFWFGDKTTAQITAFGWKWSDEPDVQTMLLRSDGRFDAGRRSAATAAWAYAAFRDVLTAADLVYGHNVRRFDLPLLNAGLLRLHLPPLPQLRTTDTLRDYPRRHDMSASLENLAKLYDLGGDKKHMAIMDWEKANQLHPDGVELARQRVASDVLLQERLRGKLLDLGLLKPPRTWMA